MQDNYNW